MDWGLLAPSAALALAGFAGLFILYRRPNVRPVARSGYTVMAFIVAFLTVAGILGALAMPSRGLSLIVRDTMSGYVEGFYAKPLQLMLPEARNQTPGQAPVVPPIRANDTERLNDLASKLQQAYQEAASQGKYAVGRECRLSLQAYSLAVLVLDLPNTTRGPYGLIILLDPNAAPGTVYLEDRTGSLLANATKALGSEGLQAASGLKPLLESDKTMAALTAECGGVDCFLGLSPSIMKYWTPASTPPPPPGGEPTVTVVEPGYRWDQTFIPPAKSASLIVFANPQDSGALVSGLARLLGGDGSILTAYGPFVYSILVADIPDECYSRTTPQALDVFVRSVLSQAAPNGYNIYIFRSFQDIISTLRRASDIGTAGSILSLTIFVSIVLASASPLAASGAVSLARGVAVLRLRGLTLGSLKRSLALITLASLAAGLGAGYAAIELWAPGSTSSTGRLGLGGTAAAAILALLLMYRRAYKESSRVLVEAVARGHPLAVAPAPPPEGLGRLGWVSLVLGLYHAVRGYLDFSTFLYIDRHQEWFSNLPPVVQALLVMWTITEIFTAPLAPAMLAYAAARLISWKSPTIASSRLVSRLLGEVAPAARGMIRLIAGRSTALVLLLVLAASLLGAVGLIGGAANAWVESAAKASVSPGILAVKQLEPSGWEPDNLTFQIGNETRVIPVNLTIYNLSDAIEEARSLCPNGLLAVGLPGMRLSSDMPEDIQRQYLLAGGVGFYLLVIYSDTNALTEMAREAGVPFTDTQVEILNTPGEGLQPVGSYSSYEERAPTTVYAFLEPGGRVGSIPLHRLQGTLTVPGVDIIKYYSRKIHRPGNLNAYVLGDWAWTKLPRQVEYPARQEYAPVVAVYTLSQDSACASRLAGAGFHVYTPGSVSEADTFQRAARALRAAHPASFLKPTALASAGLALLAAVLLAADADREVKPFMALLRLRGAGPREGARISLSLWGTLVLLAALAGIAAGLGVALGALNLVSGLMSPTANIRIVARLPDGPTVRVVFAGAAARSISGALAAVGYPLVLAAAVLAPLMLVGLRVFRGPISRWLER